MRIGAVSFQPYVYNVNAISSVSMNKLSRISDNVLDQKTDFSGLTKAENENPLKKGQTLNFQDMLDMQMQRGRSNADRVMKPAQEEPSAQEQTTQAAAQKSSGAQETEQTPAAVTLNGKNMADAVSENAQNMQTAAFDGNGIGNYRMQHAISAYEMFMTA